MSAEDLTAGFHNIISAQTRDEQWMMNVAQSVHTNADLLNKLIERVNVGEASVQLSQKVANEQYEKLETVKSETMKWLETLDDKHTNRDTTLRVELDAMTEKLESGHNELKNLIAAELKSIIAANTPVMPTASTGAPGNEGIEERLKMFGDRFDVQLQNMGRLIEKERY